MTTNKHTNKTFEQKKTGSQKCFKYSDGGSTSSQSAYWRSLMRENPQLNTLPDFRNTTWVGLAPS